LEEDLDEHGRPVPRMTVLDQYGIDIEMPIWDKYGIESFPLEEFWEPAFVLSEAPEAVEGRQAALEVHVNSIAGDFAEQAARVGKVARGAAEFAVREAEARAADAAAQAEALLGQLDLGEQIEFSEDEIFNNMIIL
jgi:hypothetical protein